TRMVEEDAYCIDVIRQIQAVEAALNKVSSIILEDHLNSCVITAIQGEDPSERERVLTEIKEVFETATKV
ncbi:MAG: metal-sensing transcriptional repressor, partial [Anaerolineales bacterium]|nr:metal-sensing transcriptional repressor [Anaerolineales bacterium]